MRDKLKRELKKASFQPVANQGDQSHGLGLDAKGEGMTSKWLVRKAKGNWGACLSLFTSDRLWFDHIIA